MAERKDDKKDEKKDEKKAVGTFLTGGFQMKGTSKRKVITADYGEGKEEREAVVGIEKGVINSIGVKKTEEIQLVIPLPPSRVDIVRAIRSVPDEKNVPDDEKVLKNVPDVPKTLEELAAAELIAEMTGTKEHFVENTLSIPLTGGNVLNTGNVPGKQKAAPLLAASLAPELIGLTNDEDRFKADINTRPDDLNVRSDAYKSVRIEDFGAAMLRGMGWTGEVEEKKEEEKIVPRDNRLGLGALSRPPEEKKHGKGNKEEEKRKKKEWEKKASEKIRKQIINEGDIVWLLDVLYAGKRGIVTAVRGVPGLDRIRICLENGKIVEIKRTDAVLISAEELSENPYIGAKPAITEIAQPTFFGLKPKKDEDDSNSGKNNGRNNDSDRNESRKRNIDEVDRGRDRNSNSGKDRENDRENDRGKGEKGERGEREDKDRRGDRGYEEVDRNKGEKDRKKSRVNNSNNNSSSSCYKNSEDEKYEKNAKNEKKDKNGRNEKNEKSWLMAGIRVKIISKEYSDYLVKASVVDVPARGVGTVRLDSGKIIENVKEKYLQTVLPEIGGICSILAGEHRGKNAILVEKKEEGMAFIQLEEDLLGVLIERDHIASRL